MSVCGGRGERGREGVMNECVCIERERETDRQTDRQRQTEVISTQTTTFPARAANKAVPDSAPAPQHATQLFLLCCALNTSPTAFCYKIMIGLIAIPG